MRPIMAAILLTALLAGCQGPAAPVTGSTETIFTEHPVATIVGTELRWDAHLLNAANATSAPFRLQVAIKSSRTGATSERGVDVRPIPARADSIVSVRTPYDGPGDYSGVAELLAGERVVARMTVFFEHCAPMLFC
jgi:hypothetical protein